MKRLDALEADNKELKVAEVFGNVKIAENNNVIDAANETIGQSRVIYLVIYVMCAGHTHSTTT